MKICFICGEYPPGPIGGVGTFTQAAARWLVKNGHEVKVIGTVTDHYPDTKYENDNGVEVYRIRYKWNTLSWAFALRKQYIQVQKWINNGEVDIVEAPDSRGWFAFWGKTNAPLVIRANGSESSIAQAQGKKINRLTYFLERNTYLRADDYCAVSKYIAESNERIFRLPKKHTIIYNVIPDLPIEEKEVVRDKNTVVFTGSIIELKGIIQLVQASLLLHSRNITHRLIINGRDKSGYIMNMFQEMIPANLKEYLIFNGHQSKDKLYEYYAKATCAAFPSFVEAFAFAPMEAMIMGGPTIFTKRVSGPELIDDKKDGLLVEPSNIQEIAEAIEWCFTHPEEAKIMGIAGRNKIINSFNFEKTMPQTIAFYENTIRNFHSK